MGKNSVRFEQNLIFISICPAKKKDINVWNTLMDETLTYVRNSWNNVTISSGRPSSAIGQSKPIFFRYPKGEMNWIFGMFWFKEIFEVQVCRSYAEHFVRTEHTMNVQISKVFSFLENVWCRQGNSWPNRNEKTHDNLSSSYFLRSLITVQIRKSRTFKSGALYHYFATKDRTKILRLQDRLEP